MKKDAGELLSQGMCSDCGKEWFMYESEIAFFKTLVTQKNFTFPKRCRACRQAKRRDGRGSVFTRIVEELNNMAELADTGDFFDAGDRFASQLRDMAQRISVEAKKLAPSRPEKTRAQLTRPS